MKKITLPLKGMHCASCVMKIEKKLRATEGVADAVVNIATEKATINFDEAATDEAKIVSAIRETGYDIYE
ncbi:MAG: cation transporter [Candidatus Magasanikbacteria bacterium]|nr:cation transporter [Candidatus Magasanikbacteria bacterium]